MYDLSLSSSSLSGSPAGAAGPGRAPWYHWRRWGLNFLTISILAHLLFGTGATYLIVQSFQAKRKQTFTGPPQGANAPQHALEHHVQMQKKQQTMSAPAPLKRITTTSNSKVALPAMPAMPKMDAAVQPLAMAGMGGTGVSMGTGSGGGAGNGSGGGGALSLFGVRSQHNGALTGTFFDFKQTPDRRPTNAGKDDARGALTKEGSKEYVTAVTQFVMGGMNDGSLTGRYFKGPSPLYATQIFIPAMPAAEGPKAFSLQDQVKPSRWIVHYKGAVVAPDTGSYHFVGVCDDILVVKFNGSIVLDCGSMFPSGRQPVRYYGPPGKPHGWYKGSGEGQSFDVEAGKTYPIDIVIGEWPGGVFKAWLQVRKDGVDYKKDANGNPILPLFRLTGDALPQMHGEAPTYDPAGPIWKGVALPATLP